MSKINLDTSPYFDDFDASKDFYKVLFKPGFPVQARELTTLQSILQNQVSLFGQHFFKEGAMVIPGGITYNPNYNAVILNPQQGGIDIALYLDKLIGVTIRGETSAIQATVVGYSLPPTDGIVSPTIFVSYNNSGSDSATTTFLNNEALINEQPVTYGNTTITAGRIFATTVSTDSTAVGSAAKISNGIYFVRGTFVQVKESSVILEPYVNIPSYRVGLQVAESIVTAGQDDSLYDNAKGFNNFSAPGADRLRIEATLTKKPINNFNDTNFIELLRVDAGEVKKLETGESEYNILKDYIAKRTYEESGDYILNGLGISLDESLNDSIGNNGVYTADQLTDGGSQPSGELAIVKVSAGKAYVRGYDIDNPGTTNLDAPKPRTTSKVENTNIPFEMGTRYLVNNVHGTPILGLDRDDNIIDLYDGRLDASNAPTGTKIGEARTYAYNLEDAPYEGNDTQWNLYLFDLEMFAELSLNVPATDINVQAKVRGLSSNATGYVETVNGSTLTLTQLSGDFIKGERISINNLTDQPFTVEVINNRRTNEVKSFYQDSNLIDSQIQTFFSAEGLLYASVADGFDASDLFTISGTTLSCPGRRFDAFKVSDLIAYQKAGGTLVTYNQVVGINTDALSIEVGPVESVTDINDGTLPSGQYDGLIRKLNSKVLNQDKSFLYTIMEEENVSKVDLGDSKITFTKQITNQSVDGTGTLTINSTELGTDGSFFANFDQERYSIHYADGTIQPLRSNQVEVNNLTARFYDVAPNQSTNVTVNVTGIKNGIRSKTKVLYRIEEMLVDKISTGIGTGEYLLSQNDYYGLRIDDEEISLNYPDVKDVLAVYESPNGASPQLDSVVFSNGLSLNTKLVPGEKVIGNASGAVAVVVSTPTPASVRIVYQTQARFIIGELLVFQESNVKSNLLGIIPGNYKNISSNYDLDQGQREQFYDYSRIVRRKNTKAPSKKVLVVFNRFEVPANDRGDFYTANSYDESNFDSIPLLKDGTIRATDTLDFRPRVLPWTRTDASPFYYTSRLFGSVGSTSTIITTPNESTSVGFDFYLGRKDKVVLNSEGDLTIIFGTPAKNPQVPNTIENSMELAVITYPPYLYNIDDAQVVDIDNRRFTMRDIAKIEKRVKTLEEVTSLSMLEQETASLQILDSRGLDRFKSGFFADDFNTTDFIDFDNKDTQIDVDVVNGRILPYTNFETLNLRLKLQEGIDDTTLDLSSDLPLVDPNTTKTGDLVTLDYNEVQWINQPLASRVETVNPFSVVLYNGNIKLSPPTDDFIITREVNGQRIDTSGTSARELLLQSGDATQYMRERNLSFKADSLRPFTRFYPFFDGSGGVDVMSKLVEISMTTGTFLIGETINGYIEGTKVFSGRSATPNHKRGNYTAPDRVYTNNPYRRDQVIPSSYSASSNILNIDCESLQDFSDSRYYGFLKRGARIVGSVSGAVANVTDVRLVTDAFGEISGAVFFRDPYETPTPSFRLRTGTRTFRLSSSPTNDVPSIQNQSVSFTETTFESSGTVVSRVVDVVLPRNTPPTPPALVIDRNITNTFTEVLSTPAIGVIDRNVVVENFSDAGAGDNTVTNNISVVQKSLSEQEVTKTNTVTVSTQNPLSQTFRADETGAFLTSIDIYMAAKSEKENLVVQIRPTTLGVPAATPIQDYASVVLSPNEVNVSDDATIPTNVSFASPIPLEAGVTYAIVLLSPLSQEYRAWIARMGENNINEIDSDLSDNIIISQQYINGSLYKSDNGSEWTSSQFEDLKFTVYKALFTTDPGTVYLNNPPIIDSYKLKNNPIETLPRKMSVGIGTTLANPFTLGQKIVSVEGRDSENIKVVSNVEAVGGASSAAVVSNPGLNYIDKTHVNVEFYPIDARGSQVRGDVTVSGGEVTAVTITTPGSGYRVGDTLGIVTSTVENSGGGAVLTISDITGIDTLYLTNVQGEIIRIADYLRTYDAEQQLLGARSFEVQRPAIVDDPLYEGNVFIMDMPGHAMQADTNVVYLSGLTPDTDPTTITDPIDLTTNILTVADPASFQTFEGITTTSGYAFIGGEIIEYQDNGDGTLGISSRGIDNTIINYHDQGDLIYKYELSGVSLRRINTEHTLPPESQVGGVRDFSKLAMQFDRFGRRSDVQGIPYIPQINFSDNEQVGGQFAKSTRNLQFNSMLPSFGLLTPGSQTSVEATVRTVSGTSAGGNETSFLDQGYEVITINGMNQFESTRLVASQVNEIDNLQTLPQNKSFTIALKMQTADPNLSPILDMTQASVIFGRSSINNPVSNYAIDPRTNKIIGDPHSSVYISRVVDLQTPATGLRVQLSAYRDASSDFRVLYRLFTPNSPNSTPPTWELFPGYTNMVDNDGDGIGDTIVDISQNNGLPNGRVRPSISGEVLEYLYELNTLPEYSGFQVKIVFSGTDEAKVPFITDIRAIALA